MGTPRDSQAVLTAPFFLKRWAASVWLSKIKQVAKKLPVAISWRF